MLQGLTATKINIIQNWFEELRRLVPVKKEAKIWRRTCPRSMDQPLSEFSPGLGLTRKLIQPKMEFFGFFRCSGIYQ